jgi:hypothetical protein
MEAMSTAYKGPLDQIIDDIPRDMGIPDTLDALLNEVKRLRAEMATLRAVIDQVYGLEGPPVSMRPLPKRAVGFPYFAQRP